MISFSKYQGIGNDFILIDDRDLLFPLETIPQLCHRKLGIGADGLILLQKESPFQMRIFNCDGSEAESCGNGLRCFVLFLKELGFSQPSYQIQTGNQILTAKCIGNRVAVDLGFPEELHFDISTTEGPAHFAKCGVPHLVQFVSGIDQIDLTKLGPILRHHPLFSPDGTNVNIAELQEDRSLRVRTFERGVEGETWACGTGAAAVAAIARKIYGLGSEVPIHFQGGTLIMEGNWMVGPAHKVFSGTL